MEFREFTNPEEADYDITMSINNENTVEKQPNPYIEQLIDLIGILEDVTDEDLVQYGITMEEYENPTLDTIIKVAKKVDNPIVGKHR